MPALERPQAIIEFCLAPLGLDPKSETTREVHHRLQHVLKTFRAQVPHPVAVDFSKMPSIVINEAAHGYE